MVRVIKKTKIPIHVRLGLPSFNDTEGRKLGAFRSCKVMNPRLIKEIKGHLNGTLVISS